MAIIKPTMDLDLSSNNPEITMWLEKLNHGFILTEQNERMAIEDTERIAAIGRNIFGGVAEMLHSNKSMHKVRISLKIDWINNED